MSISSPVFPARIITVPKIPLVGDGAGPWGGRRTVPTLRCSQCGEALHPREVHPEPGPGATPALVRRTA
ncbi:MAG: hypothetical protein H0V81_02110 [Solirubrobacterales bacterium]|nr:hypothetical protein [Solirubrobacterales bacterium]